MVSALSFLFLIVNLAENEWSIGEKHDNLRRLNPESLDAFFLVLEIG